MSQSAVIALLSFDGKYQNLQKSFFHTYLRLALFVSEILAFTFFTLKSRSRSLRKIFAMTPFDDKYQNLQKPVMHFFSPALTVIELLTFQIVDLYKVGQGHGIQFPHVVIR